MEYWDTTKSHIPQEDQNVENSNNFNKKPGFPFSLQIIFNLIKMYDWAFLELRREQRLIWVVALTGLV